LGELSVDKLSVDELLAGELSAGKLPVYIPIFASIAERMSNPQVESIKELADLKTRMKRAGDTVGLHIIDKELDS
jgi:hypothetical protein